MEDSPPPPALEEDLTKEQIITPLVPLASVGSLPLPCILAVLFQVHGWISEFQILGTGVERGGAWPCLILWGKVSPHFCKAVRRKQLHNRAEAGSICQSRAERQHQDSPPSAGIPASVPGSSATYWCHTFFYPQRGLATSPKCTPNRVTVSPYATQGILRPHYLLLGLCPPSP